MVAGGWGPGRVSRIRVLRIITRLNVGGPAIHASLLSTRLDPDRFETLLVAGREGPAEGSMLELGRLPRALRVRRVETLGREISPLDDLRALREVTAIVRAYRPHVVHTHLAKAGAVGRVAARLAGARVVLHTYHGTILRGYFGPGRSSLYALVERALARLSTRVVAITPLQRQELVAIRVAPASRIALVPLGLDLDPFAEPRDQLAARKALGVPTGVPVVGIVARLVPIKDIGTFLRSIVLLRDRVPAIRALIVGDGEERFALEALARELGLGDAVHFAGFRADMPEVFAACDAVALSSLNEGSPVVLIEALAAAKGVAATAVGGVPDVVRDGVTGLLVPPRDPPALACALARLLAGDGLAARLGSAGALEVRARFHAARLVGDIERLYLELLSEAS